MSEPGLKLSDEVVERAVRALRGAGDAGLLKDDEARVRVVFSALRLDDPETLERVARAIRVGPPFTDADRERMARAAIAALLLGAGAEPEEADGG